MNFAVRDGKFDVVIVSGPQVETWPSIGIRVLSILCSEMGLTTGQFGGESLKVKGVIPLPGTGGLVLIEDVQRRIHRIRARAVIRVLPESTFPDPFPGWRSQGLIPLKTAERLHLESRILWNPLTVILGTGNRALRFGSKLLESGVNEVLIVETYSQWGAKRFSGWEIERRHFEMAGGKISEAKPVQLSPKAPLLWQLKVQDRQGIRVLDVGRVVSSGPFRDLQGVREHPPGSLLFELEQTAAATQSDDVEGWAIEEERGKWLAGKVIKALTTELGTKREEVDRIFRRARGRLKRYFRHREVPFTPAYQGKWVALTDAKYIRSFRGVPQKEHFSRPIASIECFEEIPCNLCQKVCPTSAIQIGKVPRSKNPILDESACISCGLCMTACPSNIIPMIEEHEHQSTSRLTIRWQGHKPWTVGEFAVMLNRKGENLGTARIITTNAGGVTTTNAQLLTLDVPTHLIWEVRAIKRGRVSASIDEVFLASNRLSATEEKIEITLNGEKRLVRDRIPISVALFEMGQSRPNDVLLCKDGSCGLCDISVDSVKKAACQTKVHRGMAIRTDYSDNHSNLNQDVNLEDDTLCPCVGVTRKEVIERLKQGNLRSPEAVLSVTHVGEGKCHGQLCMGAFRRVLMDQGLDVSQWIDWRFPWSDWTLTHN